MRRPTKVIIDCDPGGDDAQALILALHLARKHGIEVLGVTTVAGNATLEHVVLNAQLTLSVCKEPEVPIFRGEEPWKKGAELSEYFWGPDGFGGLLIDRQREGEIPMTNVKDEPAVEFLIRMSKEQPGEITIIALAPLSNIAAAI
jgi:inosine-uridine nucleoside N-ribohydrolase